MQCSDHTRVHAADVMQGVYYLVTNYVPCSLSSNNTRPPPNPNLQSRGTVAQIDAPEGSECASGIISQRMPEFELMALLLAAAMHDYDHPGKTNAFLVTTKDPLAILYNDRSVLENHHAASSWRLLMRADCDFISNVLDPIEYDRLRFLVLETILATDLVKHKHYCLLMCHKVSQLIMLITRLRINA